MITIAELRALPLFAKLGERELEYLAKSVADIHVLAGEYVVHEGEGRALIITVEGTLEVTKVVEGVERVVGVRKPGDLFGEVPVALNTPFLAALRAVEPSRVIRVEPKEFHTLAATAPEISATVGAAALDRIEGLQDIAAQPPPPELVVIGPRWDAACHELRDFLHRNQVSFDWLTPDDPAASAVAKGRSKGYPIVRLQDGTMLDAPSTRDIARAVGLSVAPVHADYDVVIVGGGPAGMAAAAYGASEGLRTVLIERRAPGGQAGQSSRIENYLGFPVGVSGDELASRALQQAKRLGAEIVVTRTVQAIDAAATAIALDGGESLRAHTIILALGVIWRKLSIEGADRLTGRGIYYGAARSEASSTQGQDIYIIGAGNSAGQAALFFANHAKSITLLVRGSSLAKSMSYYLIEQLNTKSNIRTELHSEVVGVHGGDHLEAIDIANRETHATTRKNTSALFVFIGADTDTDWLPQEIARDSRGFVLTGADVLKSGRWAGSRDAYLVETSVPGIFAVGDIRAGSVKRVAAGVGEGSMAIAFVHQYLQLAQEVSPLR
ncbi:MAG TPA: FAD-dependent oxidoreductase [Candidatus Tumulicola sp.]|nr:FAD-dependent oxidoreductase [Candidatus Tumulicola sp.]